MIRKFEYKKINIYSGEIEHELNKLGKEGWELVSAYADGVYGSSSASKYRELILKREILDEIVLS